MYMYVVMKCVMNNRLKRLLLVCVVLCWLIVIFLLSSQPASHSNDLSQGMTEKVVRAIEKVTDQQLDLNQWNHWMRKNAHFFLYFILGVFLMSGLTAFRVRLRRASMYAFGISVVYAITDEVHQLFVDGRGGQVRDVLIDSAGAALGILLFAGLYELLRVKRK